VVKEFWKSLHICQSYYQTSRGILFETQCIFNKNLAIANRSRVSCAHNTLKTSIVLNITPYRLRVTRYWKRNHWIDHTRRVIWRYRDLEMWVRGHSRSLKVVPFESLGTVSYSPFIVTMVVSLAISEIFSVKEWPDLEIWVWGRSRSLKKAPFNRSHTISYSLSIITMALSCIVCEI